MAANFSKDSQNLMKRCSCPKVLGTYAVMEKNLLKVIDLLQYEKKRLIVDYEDKILNFEKKLIDKELSEKLKLQSLNNEILHQKILNHELENRLKIAEENLKLPNWRTSYPIALRRTSISSTELNKMHEINELVNKLHSMISLKFNQQEYRDENGYEIRNIFNCIWSEIKKMEKEFTAHTISNFHN